MPTVAALATEPIPKTMVQKITGAMIILIKATNAVPIGFNDLPSSGAIRPTLCAEHNGDNDHNVEPVSFVFFLRSGLGAIATRRHVISDSHVVRPTLNMRM